jgi:hypothetical protein
MIAIQIKNHLLIFGCESTEHANNKWFIFNYLYFG